MTLDTADAAELAQMLSFPGRWLTSDPGRPGPSPHALAGHPAHGIHQLRHDIDRSAFPPGGSDGDEPFQP